MTTNKICIGIQNLDSVENAVISRILNLDWWSKCELSRDYVNDLSVASCLRSDYSVDNLGLLSFSEVLNLSQ